MARRALVVGLVLLCLSLFSGCGSGQGRVSGTVTEYKGRNYILIQRWSQVQDLVQPLQ